MTTRATLLDTRDNDPFVDLEDEESISPKPRFRPAAIESPIERAGAVYAMRMIQGAKLHARMLKRGVIRDHDLLGLVGLEMLPCESETMTPHQLLQVMSRQEARLIRRGMPRLERLDRNITQLGDILKLSQAEMAVLRLAVVVSQMSAFQDLFRLRAGVLQSFIGMVQHAVGLRSCALNEALSTGSALRRAGILHSRLSYGYSDHPLEMDEQIATLLLAPRFDEKMLLRHILCAAPAPSLTLQDFPHRLDITMLTRYLRIAAKERRPGVNVLIHGDTGTGKTEFVRALAQHLGLELSEVPTEDSDGDPVSGERRFRAFSLAQHLLATKRKQVLLFDEVEDVFGSGFGGFPFGMMSRTGDGRPAKGWVNQTLESNPVPTVWVCNSISAFDAAYLRRFDLALEFRRPTGAFRRRIVDHHLEDQLVSPAGRAALVAMEQLPPASVHRVARVVRALNSPEQVDRDREATEAAKLVLQAMGRRIDVDGTALPAHYDPAFLNTSPDVTALSQGLAGRRAARLCLYGPPGTGKTAFAHHLARTLDVPLHLKRASDLQSMWLGEAEKNIANAFREAGEEGALLLIDEADSFLQDRSGAQRSWEVSQVNEMLTQMEAFEGIFIASTNLMDRLDAASLRRFDFKVHFGYLTGSQRIALFRRVIQDGADGEGDGAWIRQLERMDRLVPGDFANVLRQLKVLGQAVTTGRLLELLEAELRLKPGAGTRRIGF